MRDVLSGRSDLAQVRLDKVLNFATVQAQLRIPQKSLQRSYRVGFYTQWEMWATHVDQWLVASGTSSEEALAIQTQLTRGILAYQDHVASQVADSLRPRLRRPQPVAGARSAGAWSATSCAASATSLARLRPDDAGPTTSTATTSRCCCRQCAEGAAGQLAVGLRAATDVRHALVHPLDLGQHRGLAAPARRLAARQRCAGRHRGARRNRRRPRRSANRSAGWRASGSPCAQAQDVERVRRAWGRAQAPAWSWPTRTSALEILLLRDPDRAGRFVRAELGPLAEGTAEAARLRETLEASFRLGSHVAAAEHLQLHEHTVRNRLHKCRGAARTRPAGAPHGAAGGAAAGPPARPSRRAAQPEELDQQVRELARVLVPPWRGRRSARPSARSAATGPASRAPSGRGARRPHRRRPRSGQRWRGRPRSVSATASASQVRA